MGIVVFDVGTSHFFWTSFVDGTIAVDDVVITDMDALAVVTTSFVPSVNVFDGVVLSLWGG